MAAKPTFFAYTDAAGVDVVVQKLADIPEQYRAQARPLDLAKPVKPVPATRVDDHGPTQTVTASAVAEAKQGAVSVFHGPSFAMGAVTAVSVGLVVWLSFRRTGRALSLVFGVLIMAALGLGYLSYVRKQTGLPPAGLTTPAVLINDARNAAGAADRHYKEQEQEIRESDK